MAVSPASSTPVSGANDCTLPPAAIACSRKTTDTGSGGEWVWHRGIKSKTVRAPRAKPTIASCVPIPYHVLKACWPVPGRQNAMSVLIDPGKRGQTAMSKTAPAALELDKAALSASPLFDDSEDKAYWLSRPPQERLQHIGTLRRMNYGHRATARLQRLLEITERAWVRTAEAKCPFESA